MRTLPTIDIDRIEVASPCAASWAAMTPVEADRVRRCGDCEKNVYRLTDLTRAEIADLIAEHEGELCVRFHRRADGTVLTADCPVGLAARLRRRARAVWSKLAALVLFALPGFASGCRSGGGEIQGEVAMGVISCPPPKRTPPPRELGPKLIELQPEVPQEHDLLGEISLLPRKPS